MKPAVFLLVAGLLLGALTGCERTNPPAALEQARVELKGQSFSMEVANSLTEQQRGLQGRDQLPDGKGMLFVYEQAQPLQFWMKDTRIGLDILFFDSQRRFLNGHYQVPPCRQDPCPNYGSNGPAQYVVELAAGQGLALHLEKGDTMMLDTPAP